MSALCKQGTPDFLTRASRAPKETNTMSALCKQGTPDFLTRASRAPKEIMSHNICFTTLIRIYILSLTIRDIVHDRLPDKWDEDFTPDKDKRNFEIIIPNQPYALLYKFPIFYKCIRTYDRS